MLNELYTFAEPVQVVPFSNLKWGKFTLLHTNGRDEYMAQHLLGDIKSMLEEVSPELISNKAKWASLTETVEFSKLSSEEKAEILVYLNEIE